MSKETAERFEKDKYILIKKFINPHLAEIVTKYTLYKSRFERRLEGSNKQVQNTHSIYGDHLMESILETTWNKIEELTGLKLWPTYTYYRVYKQGDKLNHHTDRPACEISVSICLGYDYNNIDNSNISDYNWKFWINNTAKGKPGKGDSKFDKNHRLEPGDAVIYRGCEVDHWREEFEGIMQSQVFFHYVNKNGPFSDAKFDCRPALGWPVNTRDPKKLKMVENAEKKFHPRNIK